MRICEKKRVFKPRSMMTTTVKLAKKGSISPVLPASSPELQTSKANDQALGVIQAPDATAYVKELSRRSNPLF